LKEMLDVLRRQALHASELEFIHPFSGRTHSFKAILPDDMKQAVAMLSDSTCTTGPRSERRGA